MIIMGSLGQLKISLLLVCITCFLRYATAAINLENYCFGPPYGDNKNVNHTETIGTELLNFPGFNEKSVTDSSAFYVKIYGVKLATALTEDRSGYVTTPLTGWFHLVISLDNPVSEPITRLVINARGYMSAYGWMSGVGDFLPAIQNCVDEEKQQIEDPEKVYSSWDKDIEFIPCGGVSAFEPTMSGGYVKSYGAKYYDSNLKEFHLNFRISSTPSNFYSKVNFRVHGFAGDKLYGITKTETILFDNKIIEGAADPIPNPDYPILCHVTFPDPDIPGIARIIKPSESDSDSEKDSILSIEDASEDYSCLPAESSTSHFTGRCSAGDGPGGAPGAIKGRRDGSPDRAQTTPTQTDIDKDVYDKLRPYDEELNEISGILQRICAAHDVDTFQCPALPARPDTKRPDHTEHSKPELGHHKVNVLPTTTEPPPLETTKSNGSANVSKEELDRIAFGLAYVAGINTFVWDARVIHGVLMTILTFFVLPVDAFTARYFKETWKDRTIYGHNIWYFLHHFWISVSLILYVGGLGRITKARNVVGTSIVTESSVHRIIGWVSAALFGFLMVTGGMRCISRGVRAIFIALHFILGTILYLINLSEIVTSTLIKGNPTSSASYKMGSSALGTPIILVIVRFVVDIAFHIIFSVLLCLSDKKAKVTRRRFYLPPPIPVIKDSDRTDMPGTKKRTILFIIYVLISAILTIVLCVLILIADIHINKKAVGMGPMSCTHESTTAYKKEFKDCH